MHKKTHTQPETCQQFRSLQFFLHSLPIRRLWHTNDMKYVLLELAGLSAPLLSYGVQRCFQKIDLIAHPPVRRSLDRTERTPCRPLCNGRPLSVRYWEAAARGTNPNLLLRTESQHTSVDSNHSSAQCDSSQSDSASHCRTPAVYWWHRFRFICERGKWEELL